MERLFNPKHDAHPILKDGVLESARALDARGATDALKGAVSVGPRHQQKQDVSKQRVAISAAILRYGRLLIVDKNRYWILPGGKPAEENDEECLRREIAEELAGTRIKNLRRYGEFQGTTPLKGDQLLCRVYLADIDGHLKGFSGEIRNYAWMQRSSSQAYRLSEITQKIIDALVKDKSF